MVLKIWLNECKQKIGFCKDFDVKFCLGGGKWGGFEKLIGVDIISIITQHRPISDLKRNADRLRLTPIGQMVADFICL